MDPVNREPKELSPSEKFVIRQAATRTAKIAGDAITAKGFYDILNPNKFVTTVISGRYVPQASISANAMALSQSKAKLDIQSSKQRHVKLKVKGKPGKGKVYRSTTDFVRADRSFTGRIRIRPSGKDYLHSIEDSKQRQTRLAKARNRGRLTVIGGRTLRYGVPTLLVFLTVRDIYQGKHVTQIIMESLLMDLDPLPQGKSKEPGMFEVKPMIFQPINSWNPLKWDWW